MAFVKKQKQKPILANDRQTLWTLPNVSIKDRIPECKNGIFPNILPLSQTDKHIPAYENEHYFICEYHHTMEKLMLSFWKIDYHTVLSNNYLRSEIVAKC